MSTIVPLLVRGAGVAGVLAAQVLKEKIGGVVYIHENSKWTSVSLHAQCILHRGYAYVALLRDNRFAFVMRELSAGALRWDELIRSLVLPVSGTGILYAFTRSEAVVEFQNRVSGYVQGDDGVKYLRPGEKRSSSKESRVLTDLRRFLYKGSADVDFVNGHQCPTSLGLLAAEMFSDGAVFASDENVVRPSQILNTLLRQENVMLVSSDAASITGATEVHAKGRFDEVIASRHWLLVAKGELPLLNAHFPDAIDIPAEWGFIKKEKGEPRRTGGVSVISHSVNAGTIWIIESTLFDYVAPGDVPPTDREVSLVLSTLAKLVPSFDGPSCSWRFLGTQLPSLNKISSTLSERAVKPIDNGVRTYVERFTLAPLAADCVLREIGPKIENFEVGGCDHDASDTVDRWEAPSDCDDFTDFQDYDEFLKKIKKPKPS